MLGFGGWPLSAVQDVLLWSGQEVFGVLAPLPAVPAMSEAREEDPPEAEPMVCLRERAACW
jgi:hypothetical protein